MTGWRRSRSFQVLLTVSVPAAHGGAGLPGLSLADALAAGHHRQLDALHAFLANEKPAARLIVINETFATDDGLGLISATGVVDAIAVSRPRPGGL